LSDSFCASVKFFVIKWPLLRAHFSPLKKREFIVNLFLESMKAKILMEVLTSISKIDQDRSFKETFHIRKTLL